MRWSWCLLTLAPGPGGDSRQAWHNGDTDSRVSRLLGTWADGGRRRVEVLLGRRPRAGRR